MTPLSLSGCLRRRFRRNRPEVEIAARALLERMDHLTWGVPPGVDERKDLVWFSGPVWADTRRAAERLREALGR